MTLLWLFAAWGASVIIAAALGNDVSDVAMWIGIPLGLYVSLREPPLPFSEIWRLRW